MFWKRSPVVNRRLYYGVDILGMIYLNLLPLSEKKIFRLACIGKMTNYYIAVVLAAILFLTLAFTGAKYFLLLHTSILEQSVAGQKTEEIAQKIQDMEAVIKDFNFVISAVNKVEDQKIEFSDILADLSEIISDGITVSNLFYDSSLENADNFVLEGKSVTREEFLIFTEKLEQSPRFKEINSPLSNVVKKENINFRIEFKLEM